MNGQMNSCKLSGPYSIKDIPVFNIDYRGLTEYAHSVKKRVFELSDEEKNRFIIGATMEDIEKQALK